MSICYDCAMLLSSHLLLNLRVLLTYFVGLCTCVYISSGVVVAIHVAPCGVLLLVMRCRPRRQACVIVVDSVGVVVTDVPYS